MVRTLAVHVWTTAHESYELARRVQEVRTRNSTARTGAESQEVKRISGERILQCCHLGSFRPYERVVEQQMRA